MTDDPRRLLIGMIYRLHGNLRTLFSGPHVDSGLVLLEALALATVAAADAPMTVSQIGRELGYLRQSVQRAVNKLLDEGLIIAQPNAQHKSAPVYAITPAGQERLTIVHQPAHILSDALAAEFPDERVAALLHELTDLQRAIQAQAPMKKR